jgi:chemotaxis protein MotA
MGSALPAFVRRMGGLAGLRSKARANHAATGKIHQFRRAARCDNAPGRDCGVNFPARRRRFLDAKRSPRSIHRHSRNMTVPPVLDGFALALVGGGSALLATAQAGARGARAALSVPIALARCRADAAAADAVLGVAARMAARRGPQTTDRLNPADPYLRRALRLFADAADAPTLRRQLTLLGEAEAVERSAAAAWWHALADAAPPLGMAGTVTGIIALFAQGGAGADSFAALALALTSTLYGLLLSALTAGPIAAFIDRRADEEARWRRDIGRRLVALLGASALPVSPPVTAPRGFRAA